MKSDTNRNKKMPRQHKTIDDAIALFRSGKSPRECDKLTGINYKKIEREAKKLGVTKGDLSHLIHRMAKDRLEFVALPDADQDIVTKNVDDMLRNMQFFSNATIKNCIEMMKKVGVNMEIVEHKLVQETLSKAKETVIGKVPNTAVQINNSNQAAVGLGISKESIASIHEALGIRVD